MLIGYARVSTDEQNLQLDALKKVGCKWVFTDKAGGTRPERKGLAEALSHLRENDALIVWKLDRLGRTVRGLVDLVGELEHRRVHFQSPTQLERDITRKWFQEWISRTAVPRRQATPLRVRPRFLKTFISEKNLHVFDLMPIFKAYVDRGTLRSSQAIQSLGRASISTRLAVTTSIWCGCARMAVN
jgi:Resolvase, N terminal domain